MNVDSALINHCLFNGVGVYFQLQKALNRTEFTRITRVFQDRENVVLKDEVVEAHWSGLQQRMEGKARWDTIAPLIDPQGDRSKMRLAYLSQNNLDNILQKRPYVAFSVSGIKYLVEVFNPQNELGIPYQGAGEPVVVLVLKGERIENVRDNLIENQDFYSIIKEVFGILGPSKIVGATSADIATVMRNYHEGKVSASTSLWSFLFQFQVMRLPKPMGDVTLKRYFNKFEQWEDGWFLLQIKNGIDFYVRQRSVDAAKVLGMIAIDEIVEN
jgi:hypothetical protein